MVGGLIMDTYLPTYLLHRNTEGGAAKVLSRGGGAPEAF